MVVAFTLDPTFCDVVPESRLSLRYPKNISGKGGFKMMNQQHDPLWNYPLTPTETPAPSMTEQNIERRLLENLVVLSVLTGQTSATLSAPWLSASCACR